MERGHTARHGGLEPGTGTRSSHLSSLHHSMPPWIHQHLSSKSKGAADYFFKNTRHPHLWAFAQADLFLENIFPSSERISNITSSMKLFQILLQPNRSCPCSAAPGRGLSHILVT